MPSFGPTSSHLERKHDGPTRQIPLNKALVAFKQVISSGLLDRTNVRICHHSRPICVSDVMSRYVALPCEQHSHWRIANPLQKQVAMHRFAPFFVNSIGKRRTHLAQNYHQCVQKTGEIGLTEMLTLAFPLILPSQIVPRCVGNGLSIPS